MKLNSLYYGDCLEVMREWPDACVDLIYLDPPFNSNADYNIIYGRKKLNGGMVKRKDLAQMTAFTDTWEWSEKTAERIAEIKKSVGHGARNAVIALDTFYQSGSGMLTYLVYMADRINEMCRVLKDTGSIYLHCDPTASHYLKMIMDDVLGVRNFRNEVVWCYRGMPAKAKKWQQKHDVILFYAKSSAAKFNVLFGEPTAGSKVTFESGKRKGYNCNLAKKMVTVFDWDKYEKAVADGKIPPDLSPKEFTGGKPPMSDWWEDIKILGGPTNKERLGYPTQKPLALLKRIIAASSNKGGVVLDPFCGCGTTVEAAMSLKRDFIGIDISMYALDVIQKERLKNVKFVVEGTPRDLPSTKEMAKNRPFAFEKWAVHLIPGFITNNKQTGDGGVDGWAGLLHPPEGEDGICIAQVKGGAPSVDSIRAFTGKLNGKYASAGVFITMEKWDTPTVRKCIADAGKLKQGASQFNRLVMWSIEEYFAGIPPTLPPLAHPRTGKPLQEDLLTRK